MIKNFFLESDLSGTHKKITKYKNVYIVGGLIYLSSLLFINIDFILKIYLLLIYLTGLFADKNIIKSAFIRLVIQFIIIFSLIFFSEIIISETRIIFLDRLISKEIIGIIFTVFCILILANGTNFIDGVNLNMIGYYLIISLIIYYLSVNNNIIFDLENLKLNILFLIIIYFLNITGRIISGDSGAYLISIFWGLNLILLANNNSFISPFFIVLLLWYPAFENLFSILRKINRSKSILNPDFAHLHQLLYLKILKLKKGKLFSNNLTGLILNLYNLLVFCVGVNYLSNTEILILLILFNIIIYLVVYFRLLNQANKLN